MWVLRGVAHVESTPYNLFGLDIFLGINWDAMYAGFPVIAPSKSVL